jgi:outer membrane cobalamin receptor
MRAAASVKTYHPDALTTATQPVALIFAVLVPAAVVRAEEPSATVVITAEPITDAEQKAPSGFATTIEVDSLPEPLETVTEALSQTVGVQVRRFGGLGAFSTISIRGSASNQVQFYLDGVPLSRARAETVNVADLPLDGLDHIDVYRGITPVTFGVAGIGGVVNLVPKTPSAVPQSELTTAYGSFDTREVVASHMQRLAGVDFLAHLTYLGSKGDFTFEDDRGTPFNPDDDRTATRQNNAFNSIDALLRAAYAFSEHLRIDLTQDTFWKAQGVPGIGSRQSLDASFATVRSVSYLRLENTQWLDLPIDAAATVFGSYQQDAFDDPMGDLGGGPQDRHDRAILVGSSTYGTTYAWAGHTPGWFAEAAYEQFVGENDAVTPSESPPQRRWRFTLAGQDQWAPWGFLLLVPTLRYEHYDDSVTAGFTPAGVPQGRETATHDLFSPSFGAVVTVWPWLQLKGNLGLYHRAPSLFELFGNNGSVRGQPDLVPETAFNRDIGFVITSGPLGWLQRARVEYAYYNNNVDDLILLVQVSPAVFRPENIGAARLSGHELAFSSATAHVGFDGNYTHQEAIDEGDQPTFAGKHLPLRPADEVYLRSEVFNEWAQFYYEFDFVSGNFLNRSNFDESPSRTSHTLGINLFPTEKFSLGFAVQNLTDNQISDVAGFPLPGRAYSGSVTMEF